MKKQRFFSVLVVMFVVSFAGMVQADVGNDALNAQTIALNATMSDSIGLNGDANDWYKIIIPAYGVVSFQLAPQSTFNVNMYIYCADDSNVAIDSTTADGAAKTVSIGLMPGDYYVRINKWSNYAGDHTGIYTLKITQNTELQPTYATSSQNDMYQGAYNPEETNSSYEFTSNIGYFNQARKQDNDDWYKITIPAYGVVNFQLAPQSAFNVNMYIYCADEPNVAINSATASGAATTVSRGLMPGDYYVHINKWSNYSGYHAGVYTLKIKQNTELQPTYATSNQNDMYQGAYKPEETNSSYEFTSNIGYFNQARKQDNDDWYKLTIPAYGVVSFQLAPQSAFNVNMYIYGADEPNVAIDSATASGAATTVSRGLMPGDYYVRINKWSNYSGDHAGVYTLKIRQNTELQPTYATSSQNDMYQGAYNPEETNASYEFTSNIGYFNQARKQDNDDWYKVTLPSSGVIDFQLAPQSAFNVNMYIYGANDPNVAINSTTAAGAVKILSIELMSGAYYVRINKWSNYAGDHAGVYTLKITNKTTINSFGSLTVTISPSNAVTAGAMWQADGGAWNNSGSTINNLSVGTHTISFKDITGWTKPASQTVSIQSGQTAAATGTYIQQQSTGSLTVTLSPAQAVTAGAMWQVDGGAWNNGGSTLNNLSVGTHTISFKDITGWTKPASQTVTIQSGQTAAATGVYTQQYGSLIVTISPSNAITAGAMWQIDGGAWNNNGVTVSSITLGTHTINFKDITGWTKPSSQSVVIQNGVTSKLTAAYTQISSQSFVTRTLPDFYMPGNKLLVTLVASPASGISNYLVEDSPPAGWTVDTINEGGVFDSATNKVKFGLFFDNTKRTLTYYVTPPVAEIDKVSFSGIGSADGLSSTIGGESEISSGLNHPADITPLDFSLSPNEVTGYAAAWKKGTTWSSPPNPIPTDYVTRAGYLWKNGEKYDYDPSAGNAPVCWIKDASARISQKDIYAAATDVRTAASSSAVCDMAAAYYPGTAFTVTITITPSNGVTSYAVEEATPKGWIVDNISDSGSFDVVNSKVKYGPFFDSNSRTLTYQITSLATATGAYTFAGTASFDGVSIPITGVRAVSSEIQKTIFKVLTDNTTYTVMSGYTAKVYGCQGQNRVILQIGAYAKLINFVGSNEVTVEADSNLFSVSRSGATVTFTDSNGTVLTIPATKTSQKIIFDDKNLSLVINNNKVMLGNQEVTLNSSPIL